MTAKAGLARGAICKQTFKRALRMKGMYLMIALPLVFVILFSYVPMYGVIIAFKDFVYRKGITGSPWNDFFHFKRLFTDILFNRALTNTLKISACRILVTFPAPIIFALLLNELRNTGFKRVVQTITYIPHFISWVIIGQFVYQVLSTEYGVLNALRVALGREAVFYMSKPEAFIPVLMVTYLWQGMGWGSIIYLAAMSSVDPQLYEAADLDGANRGRKAWHITLPAIAPIITIQLILTMGSIMNNGLDAILNLSNGMITKVTLTLEYYTYNEGLQSAHYDYAAAIGLFQTVVGFVLLIITNQVAKRINEYGIW